MTITPTGPLAIPAERLREIVSQSATFQTEGGFADAAAAKDRIFFKDATGDVDPPWAVISTGVVLDLSLVAGGFQNWLRPSGDLVLLLAKRTNPDFYEDLIQADWDASNLIGGVMIDIAILAGKDLEDGSGDLAITSISLIGFGENDEQSHEGLGRFYLGAVRIGWGDE